MKWFISLMFCITASAQLPVIPYYSSPVPAASYGNLFLFVNAASANNTNFVNNDLRTSLADWGTNHWSITTTLNGTRMRTDIMSNSLPAVWQTNAVGQTGINGGIRLPAQWMHAADTNYTIIFVAFAQAPDDTIWVYSEDGTVGTPGLILQSAGSLSEIESWDSANGIDITTSGKTAIRTNAWTIYTYVHGTAGNFTWYTNNVACFSGGPGISKAIGFNSASSEPCFFGAVYSGHANWTGAWNRIMMWMYPLNTTDRTTYYNNLKTELGLTGLP